MSAPVSGKKHSSLDRMLGRVDSLDAVNLTNLVQRLARERELFEDIFNTLHEGVLVISADGEIDYANTAAHRLIALPGQELQGMVLWRLVPGLRPSLEPSLGGTAPVMAREFELTYPEPRTVRLYMVPMTEFHGEGRGGGGGDTLRLFFRISHATSKPRRNGSKANARHPSSCSRQAWRTNWAIRLIRSPSICS